MQVPWDMYGKRQNTPENGSNKGRICHRVVSEGPIPLASLYKSRHCFILPCLGAFRRALFLIRNVLSVSGRSMHSLPSELCSNVGGLEHCTLTLPCPKTPLLLRD